VDRIELLGSVVYNVHHRVAEQWTNLKALATDHADWSAASPVAAAL